MAATMTKGILITAVIVALVMVSGAPPLSAEEGFYAGITLSEEFADVRLKKFVTPAGAATRVSSDRENEEDVAIGLMLGYRFEPTPAVHVMTEADFTAHKQTVHGFLPGTGTEADDVWQGAWKMEKNRSAGLTFKAGYEPDMIDLIDSVYLLTGVRWLPFTAEVHARGTPGGQTVTGVSRRDFDVQTWVAGIGAIFETSADGWFNLELRYTDYDVDWFFPGTPDPSGRVIDHDMDVREWTLSLGHSWLLDI